MHEISLAPNLANQARGRQMAGGFTLIEVMISLTIITLGLCALAALLQRSIAMDRLADEVDIANNAIRMKLEELRAIPLDTNYGQPLTAFSSFHNTTFAIRGLVAEDGSENVGTIIVTPVEPYNDIVEITITARWRSVAGIMSRSIAARICRQ